MFWLFLTNSIEINAAVDEQKQKQNVSHFAGLFCFLVFKKTIKRMNIKTMNIFWNELWTTKISICGHSFTLLEAFVFPYFLSNRSEKSNFKIVLKFISNVIGSNQTAYPFGRTISVQWIIQVKQIHSYLSWSCGNRQIGSGSENSGHFHWFIWSISCQTNITNNCKTFWTAIQFLFSFSFRDFHILVYWLHLWYYSTCFVNSCKTPFNQSIHFVPIIANYLVCHIVFGILTHLMSIQNLAHTHRQGCSTNPKIMFSRFMVCVCVCMPV